MRNKLLIFLFCFFVIGMVSASTLETLGIFKSGEPVRISQVCSDATYINISTITYPNSSAAVSGIEMTELGSGEFYYDFNETVLLGRYDVRGISDGCSNTFATYFEITTNGKAPAEGIVVVAFTGLFILFMIFGLVYFIVSLGHVIQLEMDLMDLVVMVSNYLALWVFYYISKEYLGNAVINDILELSISIGAVTHMFLPFVGFMVSFIMTNLKFKQKARITY
jgi:hypothetical protein